MNAKRFVVVVLSLLVLILALWFLLNPYQDSRAAPSVTWTLAFDLPISHVFQLEVYNGKLYASGSSSQRDGKIYSFDGTTWTDTNFASTVGVTVDMVQSLQAFNGRLYIGTRVNVSGAIYVRVYYYDGTTFTQDFSANGQSGYSGIEDLTIHNNTLYAANGSRIGEVYQRNGDNNWITLGVVEVNSPARALASYNGSLYAGTGATSNEAKVWRWDGAAWVLVKNLARDFGVDQDGVCSLVSANGNLYASMCGPATPSPIFEYDGTNWTIGINISGCNWSELALIDEMPWAGTCGGQIYRFTGAIWEAMGSTGETQVNDFEQYGSSIYAGTGNNGRIFYSPWRERITLSIAPPATADVGSTVYVPVSLAGVLTSDDLRGIQLGVRVDNNTILTPASNLSPRAGNLFPADSLSYTVAITDGWDFMLTTPFPPTPPISGTGIIIELPFYAQAEGCINLTFADHILVNSDAIPISHQIETGQICLTDRGTLAGTTYLQSRASGHYTDTMVKLEGSQGTYTTTTDAAGYFAIPHIASGVYTATFTHPLFVYAIRQNITIPHQTTTTLSEVGLWAGDMNQDGDVEESDWYICAAASIPVDDPAFDINDDRSTDIRDCTILANNIGRSDMPGTNPPPTGLAALAQTINSAAGVQAIGTVILIPQGISDVLLRVVNVHGRIYATGTRLDLPAGAIVTGVKLQDGFTDGFLRWHQDNDKLYIVAAPREDSTLARETDMVIIHITGGSGEPIIIGAQSPVGEQFSFSMFLPVVSRR